MNSLSSSLMTGVTLYRNQAGFGNKVGAQAGYALVAAVAVVETVAALVSSVAALVLSLAMFSSTPIAHTFKWVNSSAFCVGWSIGDFFLNPFVLVLAGDEKSARSIVESGDLMRLPHDALV